MQVFTPDGDYLRQFGKKGKGNEELYGPVSISLDDDLLFVADNKNHCVSLFTTDWEFVKSLGSKGSGPGEFSGSFSIMELSMLVMSCDTSIFMATVYLHLFIVLFHKKKMLAVHIAIYLYFTSYTLHQ